MQKKDDVKTGRRRPSTIQGERPGTGPIFTALRRNQPCRDLDLSLPASRTLNQNSDVGATEFVALCCGSASKQIHIRTPAHIELDTTTHGGISRGHSFPEYLPTLAKRKKITKQMLIYMFGRRRKAMLAIIYEALIV